MAMIVQLILSVRVCVDDGVVSVVIVVLLTGEDSSTTSDDVTTNGGDHKTLSSSSSYPHRCRPHHNSQPRTISTRKVHACVTDYHPQYKQLCIVHCINIVFSSMCAGVGWGTSSSSAMMMLQLPALHTTQQHHNNKNQFTPAS